MRISLIVLFISILVTSYISADSVGDIIKSFKTIGLYTPYLDNYVNMAKVKNIPDDKVIALLQEKKSYLMVVRQKVFSLKESDLDLLLYFSDMGITAKTAGLLFEQDTSNDFRHSLKELITLMASSYECTTDDLNSLYQSVCEKNYSSSDLSTLTTHLRQIYIRSGGKKTREISMIFLKNMSVGSSVKFIIRSIQEVIR